jgi:hypothetical protein
MEEDLPKRTRDNWHAEPAHGEPFTAFAERTLTEAESYISAFRELSPSHWFILLLADQLP